MINNLTLRKKILLFLAVSLGLVAAFYFLLYQPLNEEIEFLAQNLMQKDLELRQKRIVAASLPALAEEKEELTQEKEWLYTVIHKEEEVSAFLKELEELAESLLIKFRSFRPQSQTIAPGQYGESLFRLNLTGEFSKIITMLTRLEEFPRLIDIRGLTLSSAEGEGRGWVELNINVVIYYLVP